MGLLVLVIATLAIFAGILRLRRCARVRPGPPGPKGLPILGNVLDMPQQHPYLTFAQWKTRYGALLPSKNITRFHAHTSTGDIVGLNVLGKPLVVLNSREAISDLLEKRGSIYSDRPELPLLNK